MPALRPVNQPSSLRTRLLKPLEAGDADLLLEFRDRSLYLRRRVSWPEKWDGEPFVFDARQRRAIKCGAQSGVVIAGRWLYKTSSKRPDRKSLRLAVQFRATPPAIASRRKPVMAAK
jgi:hypothetical protein